LVFFMQAGFKVFEVGLVRKIDGDSVGFKNLADWLIVTVCFWFIGFAFMFGWPTDGAIGRSNWGLLDLLGERENGEAGFEFFLFQLAFAATAVTIVSGALAVRIKLVSYMILAVIVSTLIYPIFGHWVWGHLYHGGAEGWLYHLGFRDFAGSTVVHSVGAWVAMTGMWFIRPRMGKRVGKRGQVEIFVPNTEAKKFEPHNLGYSVLGVLILWFGWWGFNGGSIALLELSGKSGTIGTSVPKVLINTVIGGSLGGLAAFCHSFWFQKKKGLFIKTLGGVLGGLVAITACADVLEPMASILVGIAAGVLHNLSFDRLNDKTVFGRIIDDPVGAIPVHGVCGVFGTLCVAFGKTDTANPFFLQLGIQALGIIVCAGFTVLVSGVIFLILRETIGLEIEPEMESEGKTYK
ncbi:MAG: ammonium transporter, partial [Bacteroidota bacterium]